MVSQTFCIQIYLSLSANFKKVPIRRHTDSITGLTHFDFTHIFYMCDPFFSLSITIFEIMTTYMNITNQHPSINTTKYKFKLNLNKIIFTIGVFTKILWVESIDEILDIH